MNALYRMQHSMRVRILLLMIAIFVIAASITGYYVSRHSLHELDEILNARLAQSARSIHALISGELDQGEQRNLQPMLDRYASLPTEDKIPTSAALEFGADPDERREQIEYQR